MNLTRKQFIRSLGATAGVGMLATLPGLVKRRSPLNAKSAGVVKLSPVPGKHYTPSTLKFMKNARFENAQHAIRGMGNQNVEFYLEHV